MTHQTPVIRIITVIKGFLKPIRVRKIVSADLMYGLELLYIIKHCYKNCWVCLKVKKMR